MHKFIIIVSNKPYNRLKTGIDRRLEPISTIYDRMRDIKVDICIVSNTIYRTNIIVIIYTCFIHKYAQYG